MLPKVNQPLTHPAKPTSFDSFVKMRSYLVMNLQTLRIALYTHAYWPIDNHSLSNVNEGRALG